MAKINGCSKCGKLGVEAQAVLPGSGGQVCLACYKQQTGSVPLPSPPAGPVPVPYSGTLQSHTGSFVKPGKNVVVKGKSSIKQSHGDEAGTLKGIASYVSGDALAYRKVAGKVKFKAQNTAITFFTAGKLTGAK